ncbi:T9SS type A sorting domain-containing protein [bacterium]|nr:T9SS type A sorting domain-containing protein [bacterium]
MSRNRFIVPSFEAMCATIESVVVLCVVLASTDTSTAQSINYVGSTFWSGGPDLEVIGDYAYCSFHNGIKVLDASDPSNLTEVSQAACPGRGEGLDVNGNYVYLANGEAGLSIIDVSNPLAPSVITTMAIAGYTMDVKYENGYAYLATWWHGLQIVDVSDPHAPHWVGGLQTNGGAWGVDVANGIVAIADGEAGAMLIDVEYPDAPFAYASVSAPRFTHDVDLAGSRLYVSSSDNPDAGLYIFDVSDPSAPDSLGMTSSSRGVWATDIQGDYAYLADALFGLRVIDVSEPRNPVQTDWWQNPNSGKTLGVCAVDTIVYLSDGNSAEHTYVDYSSGVHAISIADPTNIFEFGSLLANGRVSDVAIRDNLVFAANWEPRFLIADVSNPVAPVFVASAPIEDFDASFEIDVEGNLAVVSDGVGYQFYGIQNISAPTHLASYRTNDWGPDFQLDGGLMYYFAGHRFAIMSTANLPEIDTLGSCALQYFGYTMDVDYPYAYVIDGLALNIIDVADSTNPHIVFSDTMNVLDVNKHGDYLYIATPDSGILVYDVSNPVSPVVVGSGTMASGEAYSMDSWDHYLWVTKRSDGIEVFDISNPVNPVSLASYNTQGSAWRVEVHEGLAYVADQKSLQIFSFDSTSGIGEIREVARDFRVFQNYPNPFNSATRINFMLEQSGRTELRIYDTLGREVATLMDEVRQAGPQTVKWEANGVASGLYFAQLVQGEQSQTLKMVLLK